jgi:lysophospholipase L1-like esterase
MRIVHGIRRGWWNGLALGLLATACGLAERGGPTDPTARTDHGPWMRLHQRFCQQARAGGVDLLFLGDSITQLWDENETWTRYYGPRRAANFGLSGDRTEHLLWRVAHGELDGIEPKVIVLLIGTNNIGQDPPEAIAKGVGEIVAEVRRRQPGSKVLLLGLLPRGRFPHRDGPETAMATDPRVTEVNQRLMKLDDGRAVRYLDIGRHFLDTDGKVRRALMPDFLHLSPLGYRTWAEAMEPTLWELME